MLVCRCCVEEGSVTIHGQGSALFQSVDRFPKVYVNVVEGLLRRGWCFSWDVRR